MNRRTKLLALGAGLIAVVWSGDQAYRRWIEQPAQRHERKVIQLEEQIQEAEDAVFNTRQAPDELQSIEACSLPRDPELARSHYQNWLLAQVTAVGLEQARVDTSEPTLRLVRDRDQSKKQREIYRVFGFNLRGTGTLNQLTDFLKTFYMAGHLHRIVSMRLSPLGGGHRLDIALSVEALGLTNCQRKGDLASGTFNRLGPIDIQSYDVIPRRNLFVPAGGSVLGQIRLTAVTFDKASQPVAWLQFADGTRKMLRGDHFEVAGHSINVIDILPKVVLLDVDGLVLRTELGQSLDEEK